MPPVNWRPSGTRTSAIFPTGRQVGSTPASRRRATRPPRR